jgi:hypothetical protein
MQQCGSFIISLTMPKTLNLYMNLADHKHELAGNLYELVISKLKKHETQKKTQRRAKLQEANQTYSSSSYLFLRLLLLLLLSSSG